MNKQIIIKRLGTALSLAFFVANTWAQAPDTTGTGAIQKIRAERNAEFKDPARSPLDKKKRKKFTGLCFYDINLAYHVKATFIRTEAPILFRMKTTTTRLPEYSKYGEVEFTLDGTIYRLGVYQSQDLLKRPGFENYLFIPFTDLTTGDETYHVGRYIDFKIPDGNEVIVDFNRCYFPTCSYADGYSCPIPPEENRLPIRIPAGEKNCPGAQAH